MSPFSPYSPLGIPLTSGSGLDNTKSEETYETEDIATRKRSNTALTLSSSSSSSSSSSLTRLETPQSPSILGVLSSSPQGWTFGSSSLSTSERRSSHGFTPLTSNPQGEKGRDRGGSFGSMIFPLEIEEGNTSSVSSSPPNISSSSRQTDVGSSAVGEAGEGHDVENVEDTLGGSTTVHTIDRPDRSVSLQQSTISPLTDQHMTLSNPVNEIEPIQHVDKGKKTLRQVVRGKLERSRSTLRSISLSRRSSTMTIVPTNLEDTSKGEDLESGSSGWVKRRKRLRSLIPSLSRSSSSLSFESDTTHSTLIPSLHAPTQGPVTNGGAEDSDIDQTTEESDRSEIPAPNPGEAIGRSKGKSRAVDSIPFRRTYTAVRPKLSTFVSTYTPPTISAVSPAPAILTRPRSLSMPYPDTHAPLMDVRKMRKVHKVDYFGTALPREIHIHILRMMVRLWDDNTTGRWEGEFAGKRELVKFSRVSKQWRSLCLDGQLWSNFDVSPFASRLHPNALQQIIKSSAEFITTLSFRGMDQLSSSDLISSFSPLCLPSLVTLDLRGCKLVREDDLVRLLPLAPRLSTINLKGLDCVGPRTIQTISTLHKVVSLDVTRCRGIEMFDIVQLLSSLDTAQGERYTTLRIAGLKKYESDTCNLVRQVVEKMPNLSVLDLNGCRGFTDRSFSYLGPSDIIHPLAHLNISNLTRLTTKTLEYLTDTFPHMTKFELSGIPDMFKSTERGGGPENDSPTAAVPLIRLLRSMPLLERLDLEGTGLWGGIDDAVLGALVPRKTRLGVQEVGMNLKEIRLGLARLITSEGLVRLIRGLPNLANLEVDGTNANSSVMKEFHSRRLHSKARISLLDCRSILPSQYGQYAQTSRPREGFIGFEASPFSYAPNELEEEGKGVIKTFWGWKRVPPVIGLWRETREGWNGVEGDDARSEEGEHGGGNVMLRQRKRRSSAGGWGEDDRGCVLM